MERKHGTNFHILPRQAIKNSQITFCEFFGSQIPIFNYFPAQYFHRSSFGMLLVANHATKPFIPSAFICSWQKSCIFLPYQPPAALKTHRPDNTGRSTVLEYQDMDATIVSRSASAKSTNFDTSTRSGVSFSVWVTLLINSSTYSDVIATAGFPRCTKTI